MTVNLIGRPTHEGEEGCTFEESERKLKRHDFLEEFLLGGKSYTKGVCHASLGEGYAHNLRRICSVYYSPYNNY